MIKKILVSIILLFTSFVTVFAEDPKPCDSADCINSENFEINVGDLTPGGKVNDLYGGGGEKTISKTLDVILTKLIVVFGTLALLVMTIGGGYMILYHGQDELLSKGKSIFIAGLIALAVALGSAILVQLVAYLLYNV